ncbi:MAG: aminomethyl-transferring glycine dehydrogenase [Rhodospirillaceae bacterium]|nr:aminomethyl-transferring glycine dehydrogenase [Rhodospirillaceae bacterium]|tara:strand:- start:3821 stop:5170 length:1350 start_codon:yes stop_codon:yes gene_type:complete
MRYLPHTNKIRQEMFEEIGIKNIDELFVDIPKGSLLGEEVGIPKHKSELEVENILKNISKKNISVSSALNFIGAGAYYHHVPAAVDHIIQRSEFLTSYTPYQPEISQGTLQYLFEFQTQISLLTGMEVSNASMYDGASACAEAVLMAQRVNKRKKVIYSGYLHPHYIETSKTYTKYSGVKNIFLPLNTNSKSEDFIDHIDEDVCCIIVQNPDFLGNIKNFNDLSEHCKKFGVLLIVVVTEILSLGVVNSPGSIGADIVVGEAQSIGNNLNFGGPYLGFFSTRKKFVRQMPGRIVGQTSDVNGNRGFVLTLSTREQHIRRDKATSNICTNSGLCSLAFTIHMSLLGEEGLRRLSKLNHIKAVNLSQKIKDIDGVSLVNKNFFNEFTISLPKSATSIIDSLIDKNILAGVPLTRFYPNREDLKNYLIIAVTEMIDDQQMDNFIAALRGELI